MRFRTVIFSTVILLVVAACGITPGDTTIPGETPPAETTVPSTPPTEAPATTVAPTPTEAPTTSQGEQPTDTTVPVDGEASDTPWWLLIVAGIALLLLVVALVSRGSSKKPVAVIAWKEKARDGYADARWLYDALSEDLAIWRGNSAFDAQTATTAAAATSLAQTWAQLESRTAKASDNLYAFEASAPDPTTALQARGTVSAMTALRQSVDARAEARMNYRTIETRDPMDAEALGQARDREVRSSQSLAEARSVFGAALTNLSTLL